MLRVVAALASAAGLILLGSLGLPLYPPSPASAVTPQPNAFSARLTPSPYEGSVAVEPPLPPPPPPTPREALEEGVLIVVSIPSQRMFVFRKGELWDQSPVSTGKKGKETPQGIFPILQKKVMHRSSIYDDAPMPYMQRLTWDGVALHAGRVPGYPASHGCVRLPKDFAKKLYEVTNFERTIVIVADEPITSADGARKVA